MPRLAGQIDVAKNEAILDAAVEVLAERGLSAPMEEIARRAGVSKQTIYNHYGSKADLIRAMADRRVEEIAAPLETPGAAERPQEALAGFARVMLQALRRPAGTALMRLAIESVCETPSVAQALYEAGPRASRRRLAEFLRLENAAGRLDAPDPAQAAEFFAGMVVATHQIAALLASAQQVSDADIDRIADEAAARFMRAYAP